MKHGSPLLEFGDDAVFEELVVGLCLIPLRIRVVKVSGMRAPHKPVHLRTNPLSEQVSKTTVTEDVNIPVIVIVISPPVRHCEECCNPR